MNFGRKFGIKKMKKCSFYKLKKKEDRQSILTLVLL